MPSLGIAVQSNIVIMSVTTMQAMELRAVYVPGGAGKCCSKCAKPKCFLPILSSLKRKFRKKLFWKVEKMFKG